MQILLKFLVKLGRISLILYRTYLYCIRRSFWTKTEISYDAFITLKFYKLITRNPGKCKIFVFGICISLVLENHLHWVLKTCLKKLSCRFKELSLVTQIHNFLNPLPSTRNDDEFYWKYRSFRFHKKIEPFLPIDTGIREQKLDSTLQYDQEVKILGIVLHELRSNFWDISPEILAPKFPFLNE